MTTKMQRPDLRTRLREHRKARGWTLAHVAEALGTTPQTISRLETNVMTVSTDWLQRFADLFEVDVAHFFDTTQGAAVKFLGVVGPGGTVGPGEEPAMPIPYADDAVMVSIGQDYGAFRAGQHILAHRCARPEDALDKICLAGLSENEAVFARLIKGGRASCTLVPLDGGETLYDCELEWAALPAFAIDDLRNT